MVLLSDRIRWRLRFPALVLAVAMLTLGLPGPARAAGPRPLFVDGRQTEIVMPMDEEGRVPLRLLTDAVGAVITWLPAPRVSQVFLKNPRGDINIYLQKGYRELLGHREEMSATVVIKEDRMWVPLIDVAKALRYDVRLEPDAIRLISDRNVYVSVSLRPEDTPKTLQMSAKLDEYYWTVITGQADPALGLHTLKLSGVSVGDVTVPVDAAGRFSARLRLAPGKRASVLLSGWTAEPDAQLWMRFVGIVPPVGPEPVIPPGEGITIQPEVLRPEVVDVQTETRDGKLLLTIRPNVPADDVHVWVFGLNKGGLVYKPPVTDGAARTEIALPGPAAYELTVNLPNDKGFAYRAAVSLHVIQHESVARDDGGIATNLIPRLDTIPEGEFTDFVPFTGSTTAVGDGFILAYVGYKTGPGDQWTETNAISAMQKIPVVDGRFDGKIWLRFGPGEYKVIPAHPVNRWEWQYDYDQQFVVWNVGTRDLRWQAPSRRVESDSPEIIALAQELTAQETTQMAKVRAVYRWVTQNITYDFEKAAEATYRVDDGAARTLLTRKGKCDEYTELTVALLRAAGLEAREVSGTAGIPPVLLGHAWVEALVDGRWVTMDPTWDAARVVDGKVIIPARERYFDPNPAEFAQEHQFENYKY